MKRRLVRLSLFTISVFLIINLSRSIIDLWQKGGALDREEERYAKVRFEQEELKNEYKRIQTPQYVEKEARDKLGLARPGETIVVIPKITPEATPTMLSQKIDAENIPVWRKWLDFLLN